MSNGVPSNVETIQRSIRRVLNHFIEDEGVVADLTIDILNYISEECRLLARCGSFEELGTRQLYWKGRCDAATAIEKLQSEDFIEKRKNEAERNTQCQQNLQI